MSEALWIDEEQVAANVTLAEAIDIVQQGFEAQARGEVTALQKSDVTWEGGGLYALGAASPRSGFAITRTWAHAPGGPTPLLVVFDSATGALCAIIEAFALGQLRTAAVAAVATRWLAAADADELALIGTGHQAFAQVAGVAHVRRVRRIRVFSPDASHRQALVERLRSELRREVADVASVTDAVAGAPIVTLATRATSPFLQAAMLAPGAHVNAIGAITLERAEMARDVLERAGRIVVDDLPAARRLSRELTEVCAGSSGCWDRVETLADVVAKRRARGPGDDITVFKAMGSGVGDLALGAEVTLRVRRAGGGREIPQPDRVRPRLLPGGRD